MSVSMTNYTDDDEGGNECHQSFGEFACLNLAGLPLILCSILLGLVFLIQVLEHGIHRMKHAAQSSIFWKAFWEALEGELIILGLLSFSLFLLTQGVRKEVMLLFLDPSKFTILSNSLTPTLVSLASLVAANRIQGRIVGTLHHPDRVCAYHFVHNDDHLHMHHSEEWPNGAEIYFLVEETAEELHEAAESDRFSRK